MPKAKIARKSTSIDMTPMMDLAFLLITFFMLTVKFRAPEPVEVTIPSSIAKTISPNDNILRITISREGRAFFGVTNINDRMPILEQMSKTYNIEFTDVEKKKFSLLDDVGVKMTELKDFLSKPTEKRADILKAASGVPVDSTQTTSNELAQWMLSARLYNPEYRILIKADKFTPYPAVRTVVETLKKQRANRFNLVTSQEADPRAKKSGAEE